MHGTSHTIQRPTRTVLVDGERHTIRVRQPGRSTARRAAIAEQTGVRR